MKYLLKSLFFYISSIKNHINHISHFSWLISIIKISSKKVRIYLVLSILFIVLSGLTDALVLASGIPFLELISNTSESFNIILPEYIKNYFSLKGPFLISFNQATYIFISTITIATVIRLTNLKLYNSLGWEIGSELGSKIFKNTQKVVKQK